MKKVITYGTFDLLHYGHINLLKRAKALGDYLIVGVTTDSYDISRGKLGVTQPLMERIQAVIDTGIADEVIPEEYVGQKIDDIRKYDIDIFAIGSDWKGKFDYLKEYAEVVYLERTANISSSMLRLEENAVKLGIIGYEPMVDKFIEETRYVGNVILKGIYPDGADTGGSAWASSGGIRCFDSAADLIRECSAVYVVTAPDRRSMFSRMALEAGKHVLCESPAALKRSEAEELFSLADREGVIFDEAIKTAYFMAFNRLLLLAKSGEIGSIKAIDCACTQLQPVPEGYARGGLGSFAVWGPFGLLPVFSLFGTDCEDCLFVSCLGEDRTDSYSRMNLVFSHAEASIRTGTGVKSEGELVITGTDGYIYVPSPWWKTEYFEVRYEDFGRNRRYFYKLEGEGLRYEIAAFARAIRTGRGNYSVSRDITKAISGAMERFLDRDFPAHRYIR